MEKKKKETELDDMIWSKADRHFSSGQLGVKKKRSLHIFVPTPPHSHTHTNTHTHCTTFRHPITHPSRKTKPGHKATGMNSLSELPGMR